VSHSQRLVGQLGVSPRIPAVTNLVMSCSHATEVAFLGTHQCVTIVTAPIIRDFNRCQKWARIRLQQLLPVHFSIVPLPARARSAGIVVQGLRHGRRHYCARKKECEVRINKISGKIWEPHPPPKIDTKI